jgi:hypothetical protein
MILILSKDPGISEQFDKVLPLATEKWNDRICFWKIAKKFSGIIFMNI